jgi:hypothetical protein
MLLFLLLALPVLNCSDVDPPAETAQQKINTTIDTGLDTVLTVTPEMTTSDVVELQVSNPAHLDLASSYVGTTELTGNNDGLEVEQFLASVGLAKGNPYCAAFVSFILDETTGIWQPKIRSGLASHFITAASIDARDVLRGSISVPDGTLVIWQKGNTIFGHIGFVAEQEESNLFRTIEANTSSGVYGNQRDGDGVWYRQRSIEPANYFRITNFTKVNYG